MLTPSSKLVFSKTGKLPHAAVLYGLAVHTKIYPVVYSLPLYLYLGSHDAFGDSSLTLRNAVDCVKNILPNKRQFTFVVTSFATFAVVTLICYWIYGQPFLSQTYLYHIR